jgi:peroxiredoxin Q/BCP
VESKLLETFLGSGTGLQAGSKAPDFSLRDQHGGDVRLRDFAGRNNVVVYFYPKDGSLGCTKQACTFRDEYAAFSEAGAVVVGISSDSETSHQAFAEQHRLPFPLLSDPDDRVRKAFGVPLFMRRIPGRVTYVIDKAGIIRFGFNSQLNAARHIREALAVLKDLE